MIDRTKISIEKKTHMFSLLREENMKKKYEPFDYNNCKNKLDSDKYEC